MSAPFNNATAAELTMRDHALDLAARGFWVFRLRPNKKTPPKRDPKRDGDTWQAEATRDPEQIKRLWGEKSRWNIGIFTGKFGDGAKALLVLDPDNKPDEGKHGSAELAKLAQQHEVPGTLTAGTPTGGFHHIYLVDEPLKSAANVVAPGVDTRSGGGYIVAVGSTIGGVPYRWVNDAPIVPAPQWMVEKVGKPMPRQAGADVSPDDLDDPADIACAVEYLIDRAELAVEGAGGDLCTVKVAERVGDFGISEPTCLDLMAERWNDRCSPPWEHDALAVKVANAYAYRKTPIGRHSNSRIASMFDVYPEAAAASDALSPATAEAAKPIAATFEPIPELLRPNPATLIKPEKPALVTPAPFVPLSLSTWLKREIPPTDWLLGSIFATTTRGMVIGATGLGKTNFLMALMLAMGTGRGFLRWGARRPARILYIDGEMPAELMKERLEDALQRAGVTPEEIESLGIFVFSRGDLEAMPALNNARGQELINRLIAHIGGVDFVIFDNIMSLLEGGMKDEEAWAKTLQFALSLTNRRIGQCWAHHTGIDESRGYGDKSKEWMLDTVMQMDRVNAHTDIEIAFNLKFTKARRRTPKNRTDFETVRMALADDVWTSSRPSSPTGAPTGAPTSTGKRLRPKTMQAHAVLQAAITAFGRNAGEKSDHQSAVTVEQWNAACLKADMFDDPTKEKSVATQMNRYRRELFEADWIKVRGDLIWDATSVKIDTAEEAF
jgi:hypothetical protein